MAQRSGFKVKKMPNQLSLFHASSDAPKPVKGACTTVLKITVDTGCRVRNRNRHPGRTDERPIPIPTLKRLARARFSCVIGCALPRNDILHGRSMAQVALTLFLPWRVFVQESDQGSCSRWNRKLFVDNLPILQSAAVKVTIITDILAQRGTLKGYACKNTVCSRP